MAASLAPSRLALFGYAHVPWFKTHQKLIDAETLPGAAERMAQMYAAAETLEECGYVQIGLDHFARPDDDLAQAADGGRLHRNFQGYTTDAADALIGLGASSIGRLPQGYVQNAPDIGSYARAIADGRFAVVKGVSVHADDRQRARIIERLMCDFAVDLDRQAAATDFSAELDAVDALCASGIVRRHGREIVVTEKGRPFVRLVAASSTPICRKTPTGTPSRSERDSHQDSSRSRTCSAGGVSLGGRVPPQGGSATGTGRASRRAPGGQINR